MQSHASFHDSDYAMSPTYGRVQRFSPAPCGAGSPMRRTGNKIDYSKFKTKMCRSYLNGVPCRFGDQCAFSHGVEADLMSGDDSLSAPSSPSVPLPKSRRDLASFSVQSVTKEDLIKGSYENLTALTEHSSGDSVVSDSMGLPPPPAYEEAVQDDTLVLMPDSQLIADAHPPAYPSRFRFNPYTYEGVLFL